MSQAMIRIVLLLSFFTLPFASKVAAQWVDEKGQFTYKVLGNDATLTGCANICPEKLSIPSTVNGLSVKGIGYRAFEGELLSSVTIPDGITFIEGFAFSNNRLTNLTLPSSVEVIGRGAFSSNFLTAISLPSSVTTVGKQVFFDNEFSVIMVGSSTTHISFDLNDDELTLTATGCIASCPPNLIIPSKINGLTVTKIADQAFATISNPNPDFPFVTITSVTFGEGVKHIGATAFYGQKITSLILPNSLITIGTNAFDRNTLSTVILQNGLLTIGAAAFANNKLQALNIPSSVISIENAAFFNNSLASATISENITLLGRAAFGGNPLNGIQIGAEMVKWSFAIFGDKVTITGHATSSPRLYDLIIPTSINGTVVTAIGSYAFMGFYNDNENMSYATSLVIPDTITNIGDYAFYDNSLQEALIPDSVIAIGDNAFGGNWLEKITIGNSVVSIGDAAFGSHYVTSLIIPESVITIGDNAFTHGDWGELYFTDLALGSNVEYIGDGAFEGHDFSEVVLPSSVNYLGSDAFRGEFFDEILFLGDRPEMAVEQTNGATSQNVFSLHPYLLSPAYYLQTQVHVCFDANGWTDLKAAFDNPYENTFWRPGRQTQVDCADSDLDGVLNFDDSDDDNDGVRDNEDAFPLDPSETLDTDGDGIGNNADIDDDGDQVSDIEEIELGTDPLDPHSCFGSSCGTALTYIVNEDGNSITATGCASSCPNQLRIPSEINGHSITVIGEGAFRGKDIISVIIPSTVLRIEGYAFADNNLFKVLIPDSVTVISYCSFCYNTFAEIVVGDGVTTMEGAFSNRQRSGSQLSLLHFLGNMPVGVFVSADPAPDLIVAYCSDKTDWLDKIIVGDKWVALTPDCDLDGITDDKDQFPKVGIGVLEDTDGDGAPNDCDQACIDMGMLSDTDDDNDGVSDSKEITDGTDPLDADSTDTDRDGILDITDADDDGDGVADHQDTFPLDESETTDFDSDGIGDNADTDDDNDGVSDVDDAFPQDASESLDTDSDGTGNNTDTDDDGDGLDDQFDDLPLDSSEQVDTDGDGVGDNSDHFPNNTLYSVDSDSDGMPDAWEIRYGLDPNEASDAMSDQDNDGVSAYDEFIAGTIPSGSLDLDGNGQYDALTDGLLLLRGMFGLSEGALISGAVAPDAAYTSSSEIVSRIDMLGDLVDIDGNGRVDALTDGLIILRYLFGLRGDVLINGVIASDATITSADGVGAKMESLMPAL